MRPDTQVTLIINHLQVLKKRKVDLTDWWAVLYYAAFLHMGYLREMSPQEYMKFYKEHKDKL